MTKQKIKPPIISNNYYFDYLAKVNTFPRSLYHRPKHRQAARLINELPYGANILDAGCGLGQITAPYTSKYRIYGVDEQREAILHCRQHYKKGTYIQADLASVPLNSCSFDLILFLDTIEHLINPVIILKELARLLKPDHKIFICTVNYANPLWSILENIWHRCWAGNCRTFSKEVHPTRYNSRLLYQHSKQVFKTIEIKKVVFNMELFYIGKK